MTKLVLYSVSGEEDVLWSSSTASDIVKAFSDYIVASRIWRKERNDGDCLEIWEDDTLIRGVIFHTETARLSFYTVRGVSYFNVEMN